MRITEILKENHGFEGEYPEPYVYLLEEMCIVVSLSADKGYNLDDSIQEAIEDFYQDLMDMNIPIEQAENDLVRERGDSFTFDGFASKQALDYNNKQIKIAQQRQWAEENKERLSR